MSKYIPAKEVQVKEGFDPIEIEVFVTYNGNYLPIVYAHVIGDNYNPFISKDADVIERYTFKVKRQIIAKEDK